SCARHAARRLRGREEERGAVKAGEPKKRHLQAETGKKKGAVRKHSAFLRAQGRVLAPSFVHLINGSKDVNLRETPVFR
ncbi:MAG: hypothetical protein ACFN3C_05705, partial [Stomatobaculum longum]